MSIEYAGGGGHCPLVVAYARGTTEKEDAQAIITLAPATRVRRCHLKGVHGWKG